LTSAEESTVQPLDGVFAALDPIEFEVDVALGVRIYSNVNDVTILFFALSADVILQLLDPGLSFFSVADSQQVVLCIQNWAGNGVVKLTLTDQTYFGGVRICLPSRQ
jgi:hypothetical protein